ncbi:neuromacin-like protein [Haliotis rufescens]|uniref:neuromacin-like protein n=1 Tax=Haliotis rufescens TaxID=6454 RepID=UPI00201ED3FD|nr:neuromacin-like protein [Haliotis rufescens]
MATMFLTVVVLAALMVLPEGEGNCYRTWSRCSGWSSSMTGYLWRSCNDRCKDLGHAGGSCVLRDAPECSLTDQAYRCVCRG